MPIWSKLTIHRSYLFWMIAFCPSFPRFLFPSYSATVSPACSKASRWMRIWIREWWRTGQVGGMERLYMMALLVSKTLYVHPEPWGIFAFWTIYYFQFGWNHQLDDGLVGWFSLESDQIRHTKLTIASVHIYIYIYLCCRKYHGRWRMTTRHGQNDPGFFCPVHGCTTPSLCQSKHLGYSKSCWTYVNRHIRGLVVSFWGCFSILLVEEILHHLRPKM